MNDELKTSDKVTPKPTALQIFTHEQFHVETRVHDYHHISLFNTAMAAEQAQQIFEKWLESQKLMSCRYNDLGLIQALEPRKGEPYSSDTHSARLVCISPIEKPKTCEHEPQTISWTTDISIRCRKCFKTLRPSGGWEEI